MGVAVSTGKHQLKVEITGNMRQKKKRQQIRTWSQRPASADAGRAQVVLGGSSSAKSRWKDLLLFGDGKESSQGAEHNYFQDYASGDDHDHDGTNVSEASLDVRVLEKAWGSTGMTMAGYGSGGGGRGVMPGPFANVMTRVGLSKTAVQREMIRFCDDC